MSNTDKYEISIDYDYHPKSKIEEYTIRVLLGEFLLTTRNVYSLNKLKDTYDFQRNDHAGNIVLSKESRYKQNLKINKDLIANPKNMQPEDHEFIRMIHPEVDSATYKIYMILKEIADGKISLDETVDTEGNVCDTLYNKIVNILKES